MNSNLKKLIDESQSIVFLGGAGVSTESGIPDFRSVDGLYSQTYKYPPETMLSHDFFVRHTDEFYDFYKAKMICDYAKPNAAHLALAELEKSGKLKAVITQNIDGLHTAAGSQKVYELHGSIYRNYCTRCGRFYGLDAIKSSVGVPKCDCGSVIKPDVVLYGEMLNEDVLNGAIKALQSADLLIIGGTSLNVYPAAGLINYFSDGKIVIINRSPTPADKYADLLISEPIGQVLSPNT